jgi:hypothetical protein
MTEAAVTHAVRFRGTRAASGPLTWGQQQIWRDISGMADTAFYSFGGFAMVPAGLTVDEVLDQLAVLVTRHEALRTLFRTDERGQPEQHVVAAGSIRAVVHDVPSDGDLAQVVIALERELTSAPFDHTDELPLRAAVVTHDGSPRVVVLAASHLATDYLSMHQLTAELTQLCTARLHRTPPPPARTAHQPLDQAAAERSPAGQRSLTRALEHWRRELATRPRTMFPIVPVEPARPRFQRAELRSTAADAALHVLGVRYRTGTSVVLLAATAAVLADLTGMRRCSLLLIVGNRAAPDLRYAVGSLAQEVPITIDTRVTSFAELVRHAWSAMMRAHRVGQYDTARTAELTTATSAARGVHLDLLTFFNDTRPDTRPDPGRAASTTFSAIHEAMAETTVRWETEEHDNVRFFMEAVDHVADRHAIRLRAYADTRYVPAASLEAFVYGLERLLVEAVAREVPLDDVPSITGVPRRIHDPAWPVIDGCPVDPSAVRDLLHDAVHPLDAGVSVESGTDGKPRLVAHLTTDGGITPAQVRAACAALLAGRDTAAVPDHIVLSTRQGS